MFCIITPKLEKRNANMYVNCFLYQKRVVMTAFKYNFAVVSRMPSSFAELRKDKVDLEKCREEHGQFVETLRELGLDVLELEAEERYQECVAVDDTAIVLNGTALMCNPLGLHRQGEVLLLCLLLLC